MVNVMTRFPRVRVAPQTPLGRNLGAKKTKRLQCVRLRNPLHPFFLI